VHEVVDLDGITVARAQAQEGEAPVLTLMQASGFLGDRYYPAESITIDGFETMGLLHELLGQLIQAHLEQLPAPPARGVDEELGVRL